MKIFNSKIASKSIEEEPRLNVHFDEGGKKSVLQGDPNTFWVPGQVAKGANLIISRMRDNNESTPSPHATKYFGVVKSDKGDLIHVPTKALLNRTNTLTHFLNIPGQLKSHAGSGDLPRNLHYHDLWGSPQIQIGTDGKGREILAGAYKDDNGNGRFGVPHLATNQSKVWATRGYENLLREGRFDPESIMKVNLKAHHIAHGNPVGKYRDDLGKMHTKYATLKEGAVPLFVQGQIEGVLKNLHEHVPFDANQVPGGDQRRLKMLQRRYDDIPTAKFVQDFCPHCAIDHWIYGGNQIYDVQHHIAARQSYDPHVRAAHGLSFPTGSMIGGHSISEAGPRGMEAPHLNYVGEHDSRRVLSHLQEVKRDKSDELYGGTDFSVPDDLPPYQMQQLQERAGTDLLFPESQLLKPYFSR